MGNIIELREITKKFPGIIANDHVNFQLKKGEIHALLGENGAGKSTLMSILFGIYSPTSGQILKNGEPIEIKSPNDANKYNIGMVHQHFKLVDVFSILDNIIMGVETTKFGFHQKDQARKDIEKISKQYDLHVDLDTKVQDATVNMQQRTEILKMLDRHHDILIFDEPTAILTPQEIKQLMKTMKKLVKEGKSIIFITHKLDEIMEVCDRVTVLRRGKVIGTVETKKTTKEELSKMMVGRDVIFQIKKKPSKPKDVVLDVSDLTVVSDRTKKNVLDHVSFQVRQGEIVCIAGVDGNGQSELLMGLCGMLPVTKGSIILDGEDITHDSVRERIEKGLGHVPEDRHKYGMVKEFTLSENAVLKDFYKPEYSTKYGTLNFSKFKERASKEIEEFDVRAGLGADTVAGSLSGGNQQKAIIAREIDLSPKLLMIAQPTRGLDVGAIEFIRKRILEERDRGQAILLVSFELDEIMNLCDTIAAISDGRIVGVFKDGEVSEREIGLMMASSEKGEKNED